MAQTIQVQNASIVSATGVTTDTPSQFLLSLAALTGTTIKSQRALSLSSGANAQTLPVATTQFLYLKNTHATQNIIVTWTPQGGASAVVMTLQPNDWIMFSTSVASGSGITALSLNASGAATTCDLVLFG